MSSPQPSRTALNPLERDAELDPVSDPEPPVPSLPEPDPGVFHHAPTPAPPKTKQAATQDKDPA